jgi:hypothetical protein
LLTLERLPAGKFPGPLGPSEASEWAGRWIHVAARSAWWHAHACVGMVEAEYIQLGQ